MVFDGSQVNGVGLILLTLMLLMSTYTLLLLIPGDRSSSGDRLMAPSRHRSHRH